MPSHGAPTDPYSGLTPDRAAGIRTAGPLSASSGPVPPTRPAGPGTMAGAGRESGADLTETLAPLAADSIRARVQ